MTAQMSEKSGNTFGTGNSNKDRDHEQKRNQTSRGDKRDGGERRFPGRDFAREQIEENGGAATPVSLFQRVNRARSSSDECSGKTLTLLQDSKHDRQQRKAEKPEPGNIRVQNKGFTADANGAIAKRTTSTMRLSRRSAHAPATAHKRNKTWKDCVNQISLRKSRSQTAWQTILPWQSIASQNLPGERKMHQPPAARNAEPNTKP